MISTVFAAKSSLASHDLLVIYKFQIVKGAIIQMNDIHNNNPGIMLCNQFNKLINRYSN